MSTRFVTGAMLIDAPASALNCAGQLADARTGNVVGVKAIQAGDGIYPYVSAQAFRYWLRTTLEKAPDLGWKPSPVFRGKKVAFTDANPIEYWDDDLFGYMRASREAAAEEEDEAGLVGTPTNGTVTRVSPLRVGTLVSISPVELTEDFGVMARQQGDPVPFAHQFYRTTLMGLWSLFLTEAGTFFYHQRSGYRNLDDTRVQMAEQMGLEHLEGEMAYRLPLEQRVERIGALFEGLARLDGGAKQTLHYTPVSPGVVVMAIVNGGNNIFAHIFSADEQGQPVLNVEALQEALAVYGDVILSPVYVGWVRGFLDVQRDRLEALIADSKAGSGIRLHHPREAFRSLAGCLRENMDWLA